MVGRILRAVGVCVCVHTCVYLSQITEMICGHIRPVGRDCSSPTDLLMAFSIVRC